MANGIGDKIKKIFSRTNTDVFDSKQSFESNKDILIKTLRANYLAAATRISGRIREKVEEVNKFEDSNEKTAMLDKLNALNQYIILVSKYLKNEKAFENDSTANNLAKNIVDFAETKEAGFQDADGNAQNIFDPAKVPSFHLVNREIEDFLDEPTEKNIKLAGEKLKANLKPIKDAFSLFFRHAARQIEGEPKKHPVLE